MAFTSPAIDIEEDELENDDAFPRGQTLAFMVMVEAIGNGVRTAGEQRSEALEVVEHDCMVL